MKTVNNILKNPNILTRFRLLQLYAVDIFTKSLNNNEPTLSKLINETMLGTDTEEVDESPEHMLGTLFELKKEYEDYNRKLNKISKIINLQNRYAKILKGIDDSIEIAPNNIDELIDKNNKLIDGISKLSINSFDEQ